MAFQMLVDPDGVPFSDYGTCGGMEIGRQRSILSVGERGLWYWNEFLRSDSHSILLSYDWDHRWASRPQNTTTPFTSGSLRRSPFCTRVPS